MTILNKQNLIQDFIQCLGKDNLNANLQALFKQLNIDDITPFEIGDSDQNAYFNIERLEYGYEICLIDKNYFLGEEDSKWFDGQYIFGGVYLCADDYDDVITHFEELPYGLKFYDTREMVLQKMANINAIAKHSKISDSWYIDEYFINTDYNDDGKLTRLSIFLREKPLIKKAKATPNLDFLLSYLGKTLDQTFWDAWKNIITKKQIKEAKEYNWFKFDLSDKIGMDFRVNSAPNDTLVLHQIDIYGNRMYNSPTWQGELPFGIHFNDSPNELYEKINQESYSSDENLYDSYSTWDFDDYFLTVKYYNFGNYIKQLSFKQPFISKTESAFNPKIPMPDILLQLEWWIYENEYEYGDLGYFTLESNYMDDYWVKNGSQLADQFALWLHLPDGSDIGLWRPTHFDDDDPLPVVLIGSEGELEVLADSIEQFIDEWGSGNSSAYELRPDEDDENYETIRSNLIKMRLLALYYPFPDIKKTVSSEDLQAFFGDWQQKNV